MSKKTLRVVWDICMGMALLYLPVWCTLILAIGGIAYFASYFEALCVAIIADALYGKTGNLFLSHELFIMTSVVFLISYPLKDRVRIES